MRLFYSLLLIWHYSGFLTVQKATTRAMVGAYLMFSLLIFPRFRIDIQWIYISRGGFGLDLLQNPPYHTSK